jgi:probable HAF family extracellular repeat protein
MKPTASVAAALVLVTAACSDGTGPSPANDHAPDVLSGVPGFASSASGINGTGQIVGSYTPQGGVERAFRWSDGQVGTLPSLGGEAQPGSEANAINDAGWIGGRSQTAGGAWRATLWRPGQGPLDVATIYPSLTSTVFALNAGGKAVGYAIDGSSIRAFRWTVAGGAEALPACAGGTRVYAFDVNAGGTIAGYCAPEGANGTAVVWTPSLQVVTLPGLPRGRYSLARALNDAGTVVGLVADSTGSEQPALWRLNGSGGYELTVLEHGGGATTAIVSDINNRGEMVGRLAAAAVYWSRPDAKSAGVAPVLAAGHAEAWAISDAGIIAGTTGNGEFTQTQAVRWLP